MTLKESFRYQNFLKKLLLDCENYMVTPDNYTTKTQTHNRSAAIESGKDEIITVEKINDYNFDCDNVILFGKYLLNEMEILAGKISEAKKNCEYDIDSALGLNKDRREFANYLNSVCRHKPSTKTLKAYGNAFNVNGDPIRYEYEMIETTTIDFDKSRIKDMINEISVKSDDVSLKVDEINITATVDYEPAFAFTDTFEDCVEKFVKDIEIW